MPLPIAVVDAFADRPLAGNPAAVCLLPADVGPAGGWPVDRWLMAVAAEFNLSETAFVRPAGDRFGLRWFTPATEVDLCGHATLAAAHVLWESAVVDPATAIRFDSRSGELTAAPTADGIALDFPAKPAEPADPPDGLLAALGVSAAGYVGRNQFDYLVELATADQVRAVAPDFRRLAAVPARGVAVTARADDPAFAFVSRFFAPAVGVDEDPVTGSAHCGLAPYWAAKLGTADMVGWQASARGGAVRVSVAGDRVTLCGRAVTAWDGRLRAGPPG